jgi:hypothetical protein
MDIKGGQISEATLKTHFKTWQVVLVDDMLPLLDSLLSFL